MSQRTHEVNEEISINLKLIVKLESFSNHDGFSKIQISNAIEEFKEEIEGELIYRLESMPLSREFLQSVDLVNFEIKGEE